MGDNQPQKPPPPPPPQPGLRGINATTLFRITNFELFVKPNKPVMAAGLIAITGCLGYLVYMNFKARRMVDDKEAYLALGEDGHQYITPKKSPWN